MATCKHLHGVTLPELYKQNAANSASALHWACVHGNQSMVESMLSRGVNVDHVFSVEVAVHIPCTSVKHAHHARTPLSVALCWGQSDIAKLLIQREADMNHAPAGTEDDAIRVRCDEPELAYRPIHWALVHGSMIGSCPGAIAVYNNSIRFLLDQGAFPKESYASICRLSPMIVALLEDGVPTSAVDILLELVDEASAGFCLHSYAFTLLNNSTNLIVLPKWPLSTTTQRKLQKIFDRGIAYDIFRRNVFSFLHVCTCNPPSAALVSALRIILKYCNQKDVNRVDVHGHNFLIRAMVSLSRFESFDRYDKERLHTQHRKILAMFLEAGAHPDTGADQIAGPMSGKTPLHRLATQYMRVEGDGSYIALLCKHGASVNYRDHDGRTPLHVAAAKGMGSNIVEMLRGDPHADVHARDKNGRTPIDLAEEGFFFATAQIMEKHSEGIRGRNRSDLESTKAVNGV
ncbi:ankyrin repeat-containing domain protein [Xylariales sp. AK1849]|nr:ankyrin repeat-containing domain protein [Xylariales sp. AK1849]